MFKTNWQKKYEQAMEKIETRIRIKEIQLEEYADNHNLTNLLHAEIIALNETLDDMKYIAEF